MPTRIVKNALVRYQEDGKRRFGFQGQEIDVDQATIDALGDQLYPAGQGPDTPAEVDAGGGGADLSSVDTAAAWLRGDGDADKPKASDVVSAAESDPVKAQLLLDAENSLEGDPRKSVVEPLEKIIDGDGAS